MSIEDFIEDSGERIEGESACRLLNKLAKECGYREDGFLYGSAFERFLQDNSGAVGKIIEFMEEFYPDNFVIEETPDDECDEDSCEDCEHAEQCTIGTECIKDIVKEKE